VGHEKLYLPFLYPFRAANLGKDVNLYYVMCMLQRLSKMFGCSLSRKLDQESFCQALHEASTSPSTIALSLQLRSSLPISFTLSATTSEFGLPSG